MTKATLYEVIGVAPTARKAEITAACLERGQQYKNAMEAGDKDAAKSLAEVEEAYETLLDTWKRRDYDTKLILNPPRPPASGSIGRLWEWICDLSLGQRLAILAPLALLVVLVRWSGPHEPRPQPLTEAEKREYREREERNSPVPITEKQLDARDKQIRETEESLRRLTGTQNQNLSERDEVRLRRAAESSVDNKRRWAQ